MPVIKDSIGLESGGLGLVGTPLLVVVLLVLFLVTSYHLVMNTLLGQLAFIIVAWLLFMFPHL